MWNPINFDNLSQICYGNIISQKPGSIEATFQVRKSYLCVVHAVQVTGGQILKIFNDADLVNSKWFLYKRSRIDVMGLRLLYKKQGDKPLTCEFLLENLSYFTESKVTCAEIACHSFSFFR